MQTHPADIVAWVNPTSPLQSAREMEQAISLFRSQAYDTLFTVENKQVHSTIESRALNYRENELFAQTQDLTPVQCFVYSLMMWRTGPFLAAMTEKGYALFTGKVGYYPVSRLAALIVKTSDDLRLIDYIVRSTRADDGEVIYDELVNRI